MILAAQFIINESRYMAVIFKTKEHPGSIANQPSEQWSAHDFDLYTQPGGQCLHKRNGQ
jgi:hypothetical protein